MCVCVCVCVCVCACVCLGMFLCLSAPKLYRMCLFVCQSCLSISVSITLCLCTFACVCVFLCVCVCVCVYQRERERESDCQTVCLSPLILAVCWRGNIQIFLLDRTAAQPKTASFLAWPLCGLLSVCVRESVCLFVCVCVCVCVCVSQTKQDSVWPVGQ